MLCKWKNGGASRLSYANGKIEERVGRSLERRRVLYARHERNRRRKMKSRNHASLSLRLSSFQFFSSFSLPVTFESPFDSTIDLFPSERQIYRLILSFSCGE